MITRSSNPIISVVSSLSPAQLIPKNLYVTCPHCGAGTPYVRARQCSACGAGVEPLEDFSPELKLVPN